MSTVNQSVQPKTHRPGLSFPRPVSSTSVPSSWS
jgi:hypothetical protein